MEAGAQRITIRTHKAFGDDWVGEFFVSGYAGPPIALGVAPHDPMPVEF
jgi:hypothetical protein